MIRLVLNFVGFQVCWWLCVLGGAWAMPLLGPAAVAVFAAVHLALSREHLRRELAILAGAVVVGILVEGFHVAMGGFRFIHEAYLPLPIWLPAMWVNFGLTLTCSMAWLGKRYLFGAVLGAVFGPVAYWAGANVGAVELAESAVYFAAVVGVGWAAALPGMMALRQWAEALYGEQDAHPTEGDEALETS